VVSESSTGAPIGSSATHLEHLHTLGEETLCDLWDETLSQPAGSRSVWRAVVIDELAGLPLIWLIELLVVLLMIAALLATAVPSYLGFKQRGEECGPGERP